ncbi:hypothetical protein HK099_006933 [Clydaea vesicula]|uniref:Uncharacterized protein n=1 Tax=Clydaea vesicula TaxID=447962 RepID=A0AAD5TZN4_9FUNG|nr:hypothetical protein HK099_006933 [Clydaea vesicula]
MDGEIAIEQARNNDKVLKNSTSNQTLVESDDKADSLNSNSLHENGPQKNKKSIKKIEKLKKLKDELATVKTENEIFKQSLFERDEIIKKLATEKEKYLKKISLMEESAEFQREEYLSMVSAENEPVENASTRKLSEALKTSDDEHQKNLHREEFNYVKNQLKDNLDLVKTLSSSSNELKSANANLEKELNLKNENESELQKRVVDLKSINLSIENENNDLKKQIENLIFRHNDDVNKQLTADSQNRKIIFGLKSTVARLEDLIKKNEKNIAGSGGRL